jgi:hypothetical protein
MLRDNKDIAANAALIVKTILVTTNMSQLTLLWLRRKFRLLQRFRSFADLVVRKILVVIKMSQLTLHWSRRKFQWFKYVAANDALIVREILVATKMSQLALPWSRRKFRLLQRFRSYAAQVKENIKYLIEQIVILVLRFRFAVATKNSQLGCSS